MPNQLAVTLLSSDNEYLKYPCTGMLEMCELSLIGSVSVGVFRQFVDGKQSGTPVRVGSPNFVYDHKLATSNPMWVYK